MKIISKSGTKVKARLSGDISVWGRNNAISFSNQIDELAEEYEELEIQVHCYGGDVMEGIAMCNVLKHADIKVTAVVIGLAASMGTIFLLACDKVYMYKNTYQMIHEALTGAYGNSTTLKKVAETLDKISGILYQHYKDKMPENKHAEIEKFMDGEDHWLTAQECKELGIIDGVIDKDGIEVPTAMLQAKSQEKESFKQYFSASLERNGESSPKEPKIKSTMKEVLIAKILAKNFVGVSATSADELGEELLAFAESASKERDELKAKLDQLELDQVERQKTEVKNYLDNAEKTGAIQNSQRAFYENLCKDTEGFESVKNILGSATPQKPPTISSQFDDSSKKEENTEKWTFEDYQAKSPEKLEAMAKTDWEKFSTLYENQFGVKPEK
ncbi:head maturation protease, ClpP-related [Flammeovirga sp. OC4]|uniref:head maturation protease, ClpP-related n=1 Tax=Flammeovirga sp. OC4 TaxID=1382345 RepID=UPI0005C58BA6|nr:head maturation protease, ClpP-related [Flammeovirga sp. OC4]